LLGIARSVRIRALSALRTALRRADLPLGCWTGSRQARRARALTVGRSCPAIFGKNGFYFRVGRNIATGHGCKRLGNGLEFLRCGAINAVPPRLDFEGDLRKLILVVLGPMGDPRQHLFHVRIHGCYLAPSNAILKNKTMASVAIARASFFVGAIVTIS